MNKKLQLLLDAKKLFAKQGFDKTSIREIARESDINSSMISYYFDGKEGLLAAIFEEFFPEKPSEKGVFRQRTRGRFSYSKFSNNCH